MKILFKSLLSAFFLITVTLIWADNLSAQTNSEIALKIRAENTSGDQFTVSTKTKNGALVYGTKKPGKEMLNAIDKGLTDLFAVAKKHGYMNRLKYSDYIIFIAKPDRLTDSSGNYIPNFSIPVRQYAGTDYDKGGFMYVAGMVVSYNPCAFMIAEHEKMFEQVSEVVRFEGEHIVLYHNDRKRYEKTADHSKGGGHPILQ